MDDVHPRLSAAALPLVAIMPVPPAALPAAATADTVSRGQGLEGFLVIFALALATVVLIRSMVGHLRKVRYGPGPQDRADGAPDGPPPGRPPAGPAQMPDDQAGPAQGEHGETDAGAPHRP